MDLVVHAPAFPLPGQTLLGGPFREAPGGKGANQAVAAARLGGQTVFIGKVGEDANGHRLLSALQGDGVDTTWVWRSYEPTGVAVITVRQDGENTIIVAPGANAELHAGDVRRSFGEMEGTPKVVLCQLEIPLKSVGACLAEAQSREVPWRILNPAPAAELPDAILRSANVIVPNRGEAEAITGIRLHEDEAIPSAAAALHERGVPYVAITLGSAGVFVSSPDGVEHIAAPQVQAVDATAAGDCFCGALAVGLAEGADFAEACFFAVRAASVSVTRQGAQPSLPMRAEV